LENYESMKFSCGVSSEYVIYVTKPDFWLFWHRKAFEELSQNAS